MLVKVDSAFNLVWAQSFACRNSFSNNVTPTYSSFDVTPSGNVVLVVSPNSHPPNNYNSNVTSVRMVFGNLMSSNANTNTIMSAGYVSVMFITRLNGATGELIHHATLGSNTHATYDTVNSVAPVEDETFAVSWHSFYPGILDKTVMYRYVHSDGTITNPSFYNSATLNNINAFNKDAHKFQQEFLTYFDGNTKIVWDATMAMRAGNYNFLSGIFSAVYANSAFWYSGTNSNYFTGGMFVLTYDTANANVKLDCFDPGTTSNRYGNFQFCLARITKAGKCRLPEIAS